MTQQLDNQEIGLLQKQWSYMHFKHKNHGQVIPTISDHIP